MKLKLIYIFCIVSFAAYIVSCSDMNDLHDSFMKDGETIYAARLDSVIAAPGRNRVELEMLALSQRIDKIRIYWNDDQDSLDVEINNQTGTFKQIIPDLPEGEYIFHLVSLDAYGNKSLEKEVSCRIFGEQYEAGLINRKVEKMEYVGDELIISWRTFVNGLGTLFTYGNNEDGESSVFVSPSENTTTILDYKSDGAYHFESYYLPVENAIDTFKTSVTEGVLPHFVKYVECDKSLFVAMSLPNDLGRLGWDDNERMERLWDGSIGPQGYPWVFHSDDSGLPGVITFDMGKVYENLALIEETGRDCCGNPLVFEVWGIEDISDAETTLHPSDPTWPDEAREKGWALLKEVTRTDDGKEAYKVDLDEDLPPVRYIRLRFKECAEGSTTVNLSEVTFWYAE